MPGLSQLKKFNADILSLGDEVTLRASRGERPVVVPIPKEIEDKDDSEDFVLGMPEIEAEVVDTQIEDDLSDITGLASGNSNSDSSEEDSDGQAAPSFAAPDLSSLLNPINIPDDASAGESMPDLSMFMEPEEEEIVEEEPEPEEISVADMGLEALLAGAGFDEPEEPEEPAESEEDTFEIPDEFKAEEDKSAVNSDFDDLELEEIGEPLEEVPEEVSESSVPDYMSELDKDLAELGDFSPSDFSETSGAGAGGSSLTGEADLDSIFGDLETAEEVDEAEELIEEPEMPGASDVSDVSDIFSADIGDGSAGNLDDLFGTSSDENATGTDNLDLPEDILKDIGLDEPLEEITDSPAELSGDVSGDDFDVPDFNAEDLNTADLNADDSGAADFSTDNFNLESIPLDIPGELNSDELNSDELNSDELNSDELNSGESADSDNFDINTDLGDFVIPSDEGADGESDSGADVEDILSDAGDLTAPFEIPDTFNELDGNNLEDIPEADIPEVEEFSDNSELEGGFDLGDLGDLGDSGNLDNLEDFGAASDDISVPDDISDFELPEQAADNSETGEDLSYLEGMEFNLPESDAENLTAQEEQPQASDDSFDADSLLDGLDLSGGDITSDEPVEVSDGFEMPEIPDVDSDMDSESNDSSNDFSTDFSTDDFSTDFSNDDFTSDSGTQDDDSDSSSIDLNSNAMEDFGIPDDFGADGFESSGSDQSSSESSDDFGFGGGDFGIPDDFGAGDTSNLFDSADMEIPDYEEDTGDAGADSSFDLDDGDSADSGTGEGEIEQFDTSEMDGLDFDMPETDAQLDGASSDFDLGSSDEFPMEGAFEIPGFSDVGTAKEEKSSTPLAKSKGKGKEKEKKKNLDLDEPDFEGAIESENLPPNTLSDAQYKKFLKNLSEYPLNVRLAFENLIVQDEFTDDAEFEIIEKILEKAPARSVASMLEKMLDISIPVPRDFEHRTAEEYEAYKKSLSYQLKNKIIPGALVGILLVLVGIGLFNFGKNCIYIPAKASSLYKQGYNLLEASEYPQSEMKFEEAVKYRLSKKWFFNYARGYRRHKQYQRSEQMYTNILRCFNHDKAAGIEYASMELDDLANYEKAEEIVRREILDYHINDADGILLLGDIFLEWGTEKDSEKLESAREQYATLIQLYNANDVYLSRMMRYFVRTDNLREVLQLKQTFEPREKSLSAEDWTELSGYLLDKSYGPIAPSEEYLRYQIEGLRKLLLRAAHANPANPIALYNLSRYFVQTQETGSLEATLKDCIEKFNALDSIKRRDIYKYIDSYRLLGEYYIDTTDYLQALEQFAEGIHLYTTERDNAGFSGTPKIGKLYEDFGDIKYFVSGDYDEALENYRNSVELENDSPELRYRIGYIQYKNKNYQEALGSFMKSGEGNVKERNLLHAMANTLSLRGDDYAAEGYYEQLLNTLDREIENKGIVLPQTSAKDYDVVNTYLSAANNYGVTLYRLAKRTGNSALNAQAIVQFSQSVRAWDALTRNQESMVRLEGSNLAQENIRYITHSMPEFEPSIYIDIKKTLTDNEGL